MDGNRFDDLTKALSCPRSRRGFLGLLAAAAGGFLAGAPKASAAPPADKPTKCYGSGSHCTNAKQCCSGTCTNRRCAAEGGNSGCISPADCPGQDTECQKRTCGAGVCGIENVPAGIPTSQQKPGDCFAEICDGAGGITFSFDGNDAPPSPSQCYFSYCGADGQPHLDPSQPGTPCQENGGVVCDGKGNCIVGGECATPADCPGQDTECQKRTCFAGFCGIDLVPAGAPTAEQTPGDCLLTVCDGMGGVTVKPFGDDAPKPDNECLFGFCGADGLPHIEPKMAGEPCSQDGGTICNGEGACI